MLRNGLQSINAPQLLLLPQLQTVVGNFAAVPAVLAGTKLRFSIAHFSV